MQLRKSPLIYNEYLVGTVLLTIGIVALMIIFLELSGQITKSKEHYVRNAQAYMTGLKNLKKWNESFGGIYVRKSPEVSDYPYIDDTSLHAENNTTLIHINHAWMLRQLSERSQNTEYRFKITSLTPVNPDNLAKGFEARALNRLKRHTSVDTYYEFDNESQTFNYFGLLRNSASCISCHPSETVGSIRGGISITNDAGFYFDDLVIFKVRAVVVATGLIVLLLTIFIIYRKLVNRQTDLLAFNERLENEVSNRTRELNEQNSYLQTVLDTSPDVIVITNGKNIIGANQRFFDLFQYPSLDAFKKKHDCICEYFEQVNDVHYLQDKHINGVLWPYYLLTHQNEEHKVQITLQGQKLFFSIKVRRIKSSEEKLLVELSDITEVEKQKKSFEKIATTDKLTGIANRFQFDLLSHQAIKNAQRYGEPLSLIMFDIDWFKKINDTYGHDVGDEVLQNVTGLIRARVRESDIFARWGGEEFVIMLLNSDPVQAHNIAQTLRSCIDEHHFSTVGHLSASFGVTTLRSNDTAHSFFKRADNNLYLAKQGGRNRVLSDK